MSEVLVAAVADVHAPRYLELFRQSLEALEEEPHLFVLAGDIVLKGKVEAMADVLSALRQRYDGLVIAIFGNEEYTDLEPRFIEEYGSEVTWLNDSSITLEVSGTRVGVVGTRGSLDKPTTWQAKNVPGIEETYRNRVSKVEQLLAELDADVKLLVSHYALTYATLRGEKPSIWPYLGCKKFEDVLKRQRPTAAIHGHAHNSTVQKAMVGEVPVYNVSLPATKAITVIKLRKKVDLTSFF